MRIDILTLFPEMFESLNHSLMKQAQDKNLVQLQTHNFREFAVDKHGHVDDYPYGGGAGMLLRVEPVVDALKSLHLSEKAKIILVDPTGEPFSQKMANEWAHETDELVFICGHYEGFDERIRHYVTDEVSIGDYVLTNGEIPAMVMIDATVRLLPDVLGNSESIMEESFQRNLLEHPQYTRPRDYEGLEVPEVLLSGHHGKIAEWQLKESLRKTYLRRPDLLKRGVLNPTEQELLDKVIDEEEKVEK